MSYEFYKLLHLLGIVLLFSGLVSLLTMKIANIPVEGALKKFVYITHGVGLVLILVSGFGILARLQMLSDFPKWVYIKLSIWLFMAGIVSLIKRQGHLAWKLYTIIICVFIVAAYVGITKPFTA